MVRTVLPTAKHRERAVQHKLVGDALADTIENEWAAVCFFYSAFHLVRATLIEDAVFDDMTRLKSINPHLVPADRSTESHHGARFPGVAQFGVNELVRMLYPSIFRPYEYLHQGSIQVRYNTGLRYPMTRLQEALADITSAVDAGLATELP